MTPQVHSHTGFRAHPNAHGLTLTNKAEGRTLEVGLQPDGVTLSGDGFAQEIRVKGNRVTVRDMDGGQQVSFRTYEKDAHRAALGVASSLTGLPVNLFSGEKGEPVYANLASRGGLSGGRYRVHDMDRDLQGAAIHIKDGQIWTNGSHSEYAPQTDLTSGSGRPECLTTAFSEITGTHFAEAFQGAVTDLWRESGKPTSGAQAAGVANYVFNLAYKLDPNYDVFQLNPHTEALEQALHNVNASETWNILSQAAANKTGINQLLQQLGNNC